MPFTPTPATTIPTVTAEAPATTAVPDTARAAEPLAAVPTEKEPPPPRKPAIKLLITCHEFQKFKHVIHEWLGDTQLFYFLTPSTSKLLLKMRKLLGGKAQICYAGGPCFLNNFFQKNLCRQTS